METIGTIIDSLCTVNNKLFVEQEKLYDIRRGSFEDFKQKYCNDIGLKELYDYLLKVADLNVQRNNKMDDVDQKIVEMIEKTMKGIELSEVGYINKKHKTL